MQLFTSLLAACFAWGILGSPSQVHHDGSTVTGMLARLGLGPGAPAPSGCGSDGCSLAQRSLEELPNEICWGYEKDCSKENRLFVPKCSGSPRPWASDIEGKAEEFWKEGDFGYVKKELDSMMVLCKPKKKEDSSLVCSANLRHCRAQNLYLDLRRFQEMTKKEGRYSSFLEDIFEPGEIGGRCQFNSDLHHQQGEHKSPLQSWFAELEQYTSLQFSPTSEEHCDEIVTTPTVFTKLDAGVNLYHHYCDFFNLFASQHLNGSFGDDINIVIWDTSFRRYFDLFSDTWKAFSKHPVKMLAHYDGKRVCFKEVLFPLLARMRSGLYYNTYLLPDCHGSGLMQAFSKHLLARLGIVQEHSDPRRIRVTLLSRTTKHRRIVNEDELVRALKTVNYFDVRKVDYKGKDIFPFLDQLKSSHNSDIFMGMHGSGLTHLLFLPDWGGVFEIYNTEDPKCYYDLARLRGVTYTTWEKNDKIWPEAEGKHPSLGTPHAKFTNYTFDVDEFMRLSLELADKVLEKKMATLPEWDRTSYRDEL